MSKNKIKKPRTNNFWVEKVPNWLNFEENNELPLSDTLFNIVLFFVFYSPCPQYCVQGRNLQYYGWAKKPWSSNKYLKQKLLSAFNSSAPIIKTAKTMDEIPSVFRKAQLENNNFYTDLSTERIAIFQSESSEFMSIFYHIRCALAHGRFAIKLHNNQPVFIMENGIAAGNGFQVKARMIVYKRTLDEWIRIICSGPQDDEIDYSIDILNEISNNNHLTIKQLTILFDETEYIVKKYLNILKKSKVIEFKGHGKNGFWYVDYVQKEKFEFSQKNKRDKYNCDKRSPFITYST